MNLLGGFSLCTFLTVPKRWKDEWTMIFIESGCKSSKFGSLLAAFAFGASPSSPFLWIGVPWRCRTRASRPRFLPSAPPLRRLRPLSRPNGDHSLLLFPVSEVLTFLLRRWPYWRCFRLEGSIFVDKHFPLCLFCFDEFQVSASCLATF